MAGDRVQFAIDVVAQVTGATATQTDLNRVSEQLTATGVDAGDLESAIAKLNEQLIGAQAASQAANDAIGAGERRYRELEKAALRAQKAYDTQAKKGVVERSFVEQLAAAEKALLAEASALDALRGKASAAASEVQRLERTQDALSKAASHMSGRFDRNANNLQKFRAGVGDLPGPVGKLGKAVLEPVQAFEELSAAFGRTAAAATIIGVGVASLITVVITLGVAAATTVVAVTALGVGLANTARSATLAAQAQEALNPSLIELRATMSEVSTETGMTTASLQKWAGQLAKAKVSAEDMPDALRAVALAETALGAGAGQEFIARINDGKKSVRSLALETQNALGGVVARQMLGLEAQGARLKNNISRLFSGLQIDPLLQGLTTLVKLFDQNETSGKALKFVFESIFQPLVDGATQAIPLVEAFFIGLLIGALKIYIALKPAIAAIKELFGVDESSTVDWFGILTTAGEAVVFMIGFMAAAFLTTTSVMLGFVAAVAAAPAVFWAFVTAVGDGITGTVQAAFDWLASVDLSEIGAQMIQGLIKGIVGSAAAVGSAIADVANGAIKSAKQALGIASPSKVFAEIGEYTGEGFAVGVEAENDNAEESLTKLVTPPSLTEVKGSTQAPTNGAAAVTGGGGGATVTIGTLNLYKSDGAETDAERLAEAVTLLLEGDATQVGAAA